MDVERSPEERFALDLGRSVDRLRSMGLARLAASFEPEPTRADAARGAAQSLADLAADLAGDPRREVPRLADGAVGDQLAVCGRDLLDAAAAHGEQPETRAALADATAMVLELRRRV